MSKYAVVFTGDAAADLDGIKRYFARQIANRIEATLLHGAEDATRSSVKKLRGFQSLYRLRAGGYRVFYQVQADEVTILRVLSKEKEREFYEEAKGYEDDPDL